MFVVPWSDTLTLPHLPSGVESHVCSCSSQLRRAPQTWPARVGISACGHCWGLAAAPWAYCLNPSWALADPHRWLPLLQPHCRCPVPSKPQGSLGWGWGADSILQTYPGKGTPKQRLGKSLFLPRALSPLKIHTPYFLSDESRGSDCFSDWPKMNSWEDHRHRK